VKHRVGDQPLPAVNDSPDIQSMVVADIIQRRQVGIERYGTALQAHNGRDMLRDAYEEALDLAIYLRGAGGAPTMTKPLRRGRFHRWLKPEAQS
jgi:hypothetical protein